jgi:hypothetical protein
VTDPFAPAGSPNGTLLFTSDPISIGPVPNQPVPFTFDLSGLILETGHQYAWAIDTVSIRPHISVFGAGEGIRTLDPNLGKVVLYP